MSKEINNYLKNLFSGTVPDSIDLTAKNKNNIDIIEFNESVKRINKKPVYKRRHIQAAVLLILLLSSFAINTLISNSSDKNPYSGTMSVNTVNNKTTLNRLFSNQIVRENNNPGMIGFMRRGADWGLSKGTAENETVTNSANSSVVSTGDGNDSSHSTTNTQVEGVDEADIVKTDGKYIYYIANKKLYIVDINNPSAMKIETTVIYNEYENPIEMYVDGNYLSVVHGVYKYDEISHQSNDTVKVMVFDTTDKANIKIIRNWSVEGIYVTSRKIGNIVYTITNKSVYSYSPHDSLDDILPGCKNNLTDDNLTTIPLDQIQYFSEIEDNNCFLMIAGINIKNPAKEVILQTYISNAQTVYSSASNLYIAGTKTDYYKNSFLSRSYTYQTVVSRFELSDGDAVFKSMGVIDGTLLNQFSMDEYNGHFRAATTAQKEDNLLFTSVNNLFILNSDMEITGSITDLAPGEQIYSVRFMGSKAYMVTYKTVDPLFVIDTEDPSNPKVLGALKIPGYSSYLHPYDENHLIGFGMSTRETSPNTAITEGIKMSLFDISDFNNPKEKFSTSLGKEGSHSELLDNHKALLYSKDKNIFAFPAYICNRTEYNRTFQGFFNYSIDLERGFIFKGAVSHLDNANTGYNYYTPQEEYFKYINRGIYVGNVLYTFSNSKIVAHTLDKMEYISDITL